MAAEFDAYLYALEVTGDECDISRIASLNVGASGETAIANKVCRLRKGYHHDPHTTYFPVLTVSKLPPYPLDEWVHSQISRLENMSRLLLD